MDKYEKANAESSLLLIREATERCLADLDFSSLESAYEVYKEQLNSIEDVMPWIVPEKKRIRIFVEEEDL